MNPESTVTLGHIKTICIRHSIEYESHTRVSIGFTNEIYRLNKDLILKVYKSGNVKGFQTENALLKANISTRMPKLVASNDLHDVLDRDYIIMTYIKGVPAGHVWHKMNDMQREKLVQDYSTVLKLINSVNQEVLPFRSKYSWAESIVKRHAEMSKELLDKGTITHSQYTTTIKLSTDNSSCLETSTLCPVFWDIHFDNVLVDDDYSLMGLIDLENVEIAALDYPLYVVKKLMNEPEKYATLENEQHTYKEDYKDLWAWYQKYYPEMFEFNNLDKRLKMYELIDVLHLLKDWSADKSLVRKYNDLINAN
jgi:aminoglycoside phosphotransferase (APT) family kinase protein